MAEQIKKRGGVGLTSVCTRSKTVWISHSQREQDNTVRVGRPGGGKGGGGGGDCYRSEKV